MYFYSYVSLCHPVNPVKQKKDDLYLIFRESRLGCLGHVDHSSGAIRTACDIQVDSGLKPGRPKIWKKLMESDCPEWKLWTVNPQIRNTWVALDSTFSGSSEGTEGSLANQVIVDSTKATPWQQNGEQNCRNSSVCNLKLFDL